MARQSTQGRLQPRHNRLLAALPEAEYQALAPALEPLALAPGMALYESGEAQPYLYFPASGIVSLLYLLEDGSTTEIALSGREGVVGISLFMGGGVTPSRAVVQIAGHAWRRRAPAAAPALHAGADHADDADRRVQPAPLRGSAGVPLAAARAGSPRYGRDRDDAGAHRGTCRRAPRRRHRGGRQAAGGRRDRIQPRAHPRARARRARAAGVRVLRGRENRVRAFAAGGARHACDGRFATRRPFLTAETPRTPRASSSALAMPSSERTKPVRFTTPSCVST